MNLITRTVLLFLISCIAITLQNTHNQEDDQVFQDQDDSVRGKRAIVIKRKTGPIRQIFGLIYDQWNDTRSTYNTLSNVINDNFLPENTTTTTTTQSPNSTVTVKQPPYKITRTEFSQILRRNLKGLQRLYKLELMDALKQSVINDREYRKNISKEVSKFL